MKESTMILCDKDADYAKALVQAFQREKELEVSYRILTDPSKMISYIKEDIRIYVMSEEAYEEGMLPGIKGMQEEERQKLIRRCFVLTEQATKQYEGATCLFKYQPVHAIIEPIKAWMSKEYKDLVWRDRKVKVIGVMEAVNGEAACLFAHLLAKMCSETKRTLLVNLELFPFQYGVQKTEYTLSDYIYAVSTGSSLTDVIAKGMQYAHGALRCTAPIPCYEDLYELKNEDVNLFIKHLREQSECEVMVVLLDFLRPFAMELLSVCDKIVSCDTNSVVAAKKREQLQQMFTLEQKEWVLENHSYCNVTAEYLLANISAEGEISPQAKEMFYEYVTTLVS